MSCIINYELQIMRKHVYIIALFFTILMGCKQVSKNDTAVKEDKENTVSVAEVAQKLITVLTSKGFKIIADINHQEGAQKMNLDLRPTRTLVFGNPKGGTLLMHQAQEMALDLPLKVLIWEDEKNEVKISYFNGTDLTSRYGITNPEALINKIDGLFTGITGDRGEQLSQDNGSLLKTIIRKKSPYDAATTYNRLQEIITEKGLTIMAKVPHDKAAASVGLELRPTRLLLFGNPKVGTLFMQSDQRMGLDLPLKVLVYENESGEVFVSYYDASFLTKRYKIEDKDAVVQKVNGALDAITEAVIAQ